MGQIWSGKTIGVGSAVGLEFFQKWLNWLRDNASTLIFLSVLTWCAKNLTFKCKLVKVINLISTMQLWQDDVEWLIMSTTDFVITKYNHPLISNKWMSGPKLNSNCYSMLGFSKLMKPGSQVPYVQWSANTQPKPLSAAPDASVKKFISSAISSLEKSIKGLDTDSGAERKLSHMVRSRLISESTFRW